MTMVMQRGAAGSPPDYQDAFPFQVFEVSDKGGKPFASVEAAIGWLAEVSRANGSSRFFGLGRHDKMMALTGNGPGAQEYAFLIAAALYYVTLLLGTCEQYQQEIAAALARDTPDEPEAVVGFLNALKHAAHDLRPLIVLSVQDEAKAEKR